MKLQERIELLNKLGSYMLSDDEAWQVAKRKAHADNSWFTDEFVDLSIQNIVRNYLQVDALEKLVKYYLIPEENKQPKTVGIVMAGNIPLVGFHDFLAVFLTGHIAAIKPSSKDTALIKQLITQLWEWNAATEELVVLRDLLKNCDAYIATGSDNSARYFEAYFSKYPNIIRKNRTSVAILDGNETENELAKLGDDAYQFFGLGCRNVTQLYVPRNYDFKPLLDAFSKYNYLINHNKYKNNYDYNLAVQIINNHYYMTNGSILMVENPSPFSPIAQLHYQFYDHLDEVENKLNSNNAIQCVVGKNHIAFGEAQCPSITDFADGVDTIDFLVRL
ncbi:MAG: acyl-CoA reductase [Chitinophagaceae bacterium]